MPIIKGALPLLNEAGGQPTNWLKLKRNTAFTWYSFVGVCAHKSILAIRHNERKPMAIERFSKNVTVLCKKRFLKTGH
jgi:hypothetical protein